MYVSDKKTRISASPRGTEGKPHASKTKSIVAIVLTASIHNHMIRGDTQATATRCVLALPALRSAVARRMPRQCRSNAKAPLASPDRCTASLDRERSAAPSDSIGSRTASAGGTQRSDSYRDWPARVSLQTQSGRLRQESLWPQTQTARLQVVNSIRQLWRRAWQWHLYR